MRMSITTTSGRWTRISCEGRGAGRGLANDFDTGLGVQQGAEAGADHRLILGEDDPDDASSAAPARSKGSVACTRQPPSGRGPAVTSSTERRGALAHPPEPEARAVVGRGGAAVVSDLDAQRGAIAADLHASGRRVRVAHRVGQRLLNDAKRRAADRGWIRPCR